MNLTLIAAAVSAALAGSVGFGAAWTLQGRAIDTLKMEAKDAIISQQWSARASIERATLALTKAQNDAQARRTGIDAAVDSNGAGLIGLRDTATAVRAAATTPDASAAYANTVSELFDQCGRELVKVAGRADGHVNDIQALMDAWPR